jgi:O-antigen ligase
MLRLRWYWLIAIFGAVGLMASLVMISYPKPSVFALVLIAPFVAIISPLVWTEFKRCSRTMLRSLRWYHWLWFLIFLSGLTYRVRDVQQIQSSLVDPAALFRIALEFITFLVLAWRLAFRKTNWVGSLFRGLTGLLAIYALMCFASTVWSAFPAWTAFKSLEYLLDVMLLASIVVSIESLESYKDFMDWTWILYTVALISVWIGAVVAPDLALHPIAGVFKVQLKGAWPNIAADSVGEFGAVLSTIAFARLVLRPGNLHNRVWYSLLFLFGGVSMLMAQARTAIGGFGMAVMLVLILSRRWGLAAFLTFTGTLVAAPLVISGWLWEYLQRGQTEQQLSTLSSRVEWWHFAWEKFSQQPLIGYGAYAAGRFVVMTGLQMGKTSSTHSDWVEILVGTGLWGLIPAVLALLGTCWVLVSLFRHPVGEPLEKELTIEALAVILLVFVRTFFNVNCFWHPPLIFFAVLGYAEFLRRRRREMPEFPAEPELVGAELNV